ncbi:spore germination protein [Paenibacillus ginsengarvi]|uniref:Spore germination protein n=1 Tax=Paenibacillus ginsengarvi TaxID=400777 RepID=A0A3B0AWK4_9BACL|nr:spore germination protein [Paenibacillus ginsengarvi]RKN64873.1 spore germination protein [Paenibacillus ginsengarvi]
MRAIVSFFKLLFRPKRYKSSKRPPAPPIPKPASAQTTGDSVSAELDHNLIRLGQLLQGAADLQIRRLKVAPDGTDAFLAYLDGLTDKNSVQNTVLHNLMYERRDSGADIPATVGGAAIASFWQDIEYSILSGQSVLFIQGDTRAYLIDTKGWPQREISDPQLEASLKGAHQGFVETAGQNVALIRRYIANRELIVKQATIGERGKALVYLIYLRDVASEEVIAELESRMKAVSVDAVINTGELAELIEDHVYSPFPQFILTERPDSVASQILQGRIAVVVDRSPSVLVAPASFIAFFQSVDDYSTRWIVASFIRLLRYAAFFVALFLPALYVALISFNYEVIPMELFFSIAETRERVPFTPVVEALLMEITLEMMREAGIRLPSPVGQTVGIVGGIVIGQAAVQAGIVSNIMVIIVAATAIASFIIPSYDMGAAIRLLRFLMMLLAATFGIVGLVVGWMLLIAHLVRLTSLGVPYASPLAPFRFADIKDLFIRFPLWTMKTRPKSIPTRQSVRQGKKRGNRW